jgi:hypothetical protein
MRRLSVALLLAPLASCFTYAPSTTDWRKTPKIVLQICSPATHGASAQVVLYRSAPLKSLNCDGAGFNARARTDTGQEVFERMLEDPSRFHEAIGVATHEGALSRFYVFAMPRSYSSDWSSWVAPVGVELSCLTDVDKGTYSRGRTPLALEALRFAPKLRTKLELPSQYENRSLPGAKTETISPC